MEAAAQKTELDGDKWSVDYVPPGATRHKSSHVSHCTVYGYYFQ